MNENPYQSPGLVGQVQELDLFRDFGVIPYSISPPAEKVRAYFPAVTVFGQYLFTNLLSGFGIGVALLFGLGLSFPVNVLAAAAPIAAFGFLVYVATRNDYAWVELDGETIRAKHLYSRRVVERSIDEIDDLFTLVIVLRAFPTKLAEASIGRVRGIVIRFRDKRTPLQVCRKDPTMKNAKGLIEAIIYRMGVKGRLDTEIVNLEGAPLIRRIYWKAPAAPLKKPL